jgi:hypothetical protein
MLTVLRDHRRLVVALLLVLLLGAILAVGTARPAGSVGMDSVRSEICLEAGEKTASYSMKGLYNLTDKDAVVATPTSWPGKGTSLLYVKRKFGTDQIRIVFDAPVTKRTCVSFMVWRMNSFG